MKINLCLILTTVSLLFFQKVNFGQAPNLKSSASFAIFTSAGAITNSGQTTVTGNLGAFAGANSEAPLQTVNGETHLGDSVAAQAASDIKTAYDQLITTTCGSAISLTTLGSGQTITPGVYCLGAATTINGELILDAQGDPNAVFIFLISGALTTTTGSDITLKNGASECHVFFGVTGAVSLGSGSTFMGTVLGHGAISLAKGASLFGRALTCAGAIELYNNTVTNRCPDCAAIVTPTVYVTQPTDTIATGTIAVISDISGLTFSLNTTDSAIFTNTTGVFINLFPGTYILRSQNEAGCTSANLLVIINAQSAPIEVKDSIVTSYPAVSITKPANNVTYPAGGNVYFTATASDVDGTISKVAFYNGTTLIHTEYATPYGYLWKNVLPGNYTLTVKATDNSGLVSTSPAIYITVLQNKAPTVGITNPVNNAVYQARATVTINATVADADGSVYSVKFYNGTTYLKTDFTRPYTYTISNLAAGEYSLTAKATDNNGAETISAVVAVTVKASNIAPTVSITTPSNDTTFAAPAKVTVNALAADAEGIYSVKFYKGGTYLKTVFTSPYTYTFSNLSAGTHTITAKATNNTGAETMSAPITLTVSSAKVSNRPFVENDKIALNDALKLKVYPNPATTFVNLVTSQLQNKPVTISIISASGVVMQTMRTTSLDQPVRLNVSSLEPGVYTINVNVGEKVLYNKFVKL